MLAHIYIYIYIWIYMYEGILLHFLSLAHTYALALSQKGVSAFLRISTRAMPASFSSVCQWIPTGIKCVKKSS